ncbi:Nuclear transport factor 2 family protein, partial [Prunus dulcis]
IFVARHEATTKLTILAKPSLSLSHSLRFRTGFARNKLSSSAMEKNQQDKEEYMDQKREAGCKGACEFISRKHLSDDIMPHILNLYGSRATASDFEIYSPNASFEDPLMCARGLKQIKSAFYSLPKIFSESRIVEYDITENMISPGNHEILIDNKQHYKFMGKTWDKKPLWNRETVKIPLIGRVVEMTRRGSMLATHVLMGFGKDPSTAS